VHLLYCGGDVVVVVVVVVVVNIVVDIVDALVTLADHLRV
jgi:hypothetical protein